MVVTFIRSYGVVESEVSDVDETVLPPSIHQRSQPKRRRRRQVRKDGAAAGRVQRATDENRRTDGWRNGQRID